MRELTPEQLDALERNVTVPVYLIETWLGEDRYLSSSWDVEVDDQLYEGGIVTITSLDNWSQVQLDLINPDYALTQLIVSGNWRGQRCRISWIPTVQSLYWEPGYVAPGYYRPFVYGDPIVILDGELSSASVSDRVTLLARGRGTMRNWTPRLRIEPPVFNHLIPPGTTLSVFGELYTIEGQS